MMFETNCVLCHVGLMYPTPGSICSHCAKWAADQKHMTTRAMQGAINQSKLAQWFLEEHGRSLAEGPVLKPIPIENQYQGAVRLWRLWKISLGSLKGLVYDAKPWEPGENRAELDPQDIAAASGFHGFNSLDEMISQEESKWKNSQIVGAGFVAGSILCYGRIKVGTKGARAECAVPEYMIHSHPEYVNSGIALKYQMKIITPDQAYDLKTGLVPYRRPVSLEDLLEAPE